VIGKRGGVWGGLFFVGVFCFWFFSFLGGVFSMAAGLFGPEELSLRLTAVLLPAGDLSVATIADRPDAAEDRRTAASDPRKGGRPKRVFRTRARSERVIQGVREAATENVQERVTAGPVGGASANGPGTPRCCGRRSKRSTPTSP